MPEGPEIRRAADQLAAVLVGQSLEQVFFAQEHFPELAHCANKLVGQQVLRIDTHGKAMLTRLDGGQTIYSHNQLYGRWRICKRGEYPDTKRSLRMALHTVTHSALLYSSSEIELLSSDELIRHHFLSRLGPDVLDAELNWTILRDRAISSEFSRRSLGALYLDQHYLAGIGNYLRSEILFAARLSPWCKPCELSHSELSRLSRQTLAIARRSYKTGGITNPPKLTARLRAVLRGKSLGKGAKRLPLDKEDYRFSVFRRAGKSCYICGTEIKRVNVGSQALYYCPACQSRGFGHSVK
ncbi:MAG: endonuclease VIII [Gammaproteobacteria bacterium]|nr:endonuclease VIII [Gammaproteobacteria bacterium]MCP4090232.1 endonuclease VIII [Gammaproteobacteria bacterium]MCP4930104.1 endonuclease VIII [Gammaproteobacteria bacterium]